MHVFSSLLLLGQPLSCQTRLPLLNSTYYYSVAYLVLLVPLHCTAVVGPLVGGQRRVRGASRNSVVTQSSDAVTHAATATATATATTTVLLNSSAK